MPAPVRSFVAALALLTAPVLSAQAPWDDTNRPSLVFGLSQLALGGGNVEATWHTRRIVVAWSHGAGLKLSGAAGPSQWATQQIAARMPWTTGLGIGPRLTERLDLRLEIKRHAFAIHPEQDDFRGPPLVRYETTTIGIGAYYRWHPFARAANPLRGLLVVPSVRYWPNVASTLPGDTAVFTHPVTGQRVVHRAAEQGLPGTGGLVLNVSIGLTF